MQATAEQVSQMSEWLKSDEAAQHWSNFVQSIREQYVRKGTLSERQWDALERTLSAKAKPRDASNDRQLPSLRPMIQLFTAGSQKNWWRFSLKTESGDRVFFYPAGKRSRYHGWVQVKTSRHGWVGRIEHRGGHLHSGPNMQTEALELIESFARDPEAAAKAYGQRTRTCCFCNTLLDDERSKATGYGPVCAKKRGLAWGSA